jgi:glycosyltransferase involved in cell wall biosynthesis
MRVALINNVAWNASILARGLRRLGVEADSFDRGGGYFGELPMWERGFFRASSNGIRVNDQCWDWDRVTDDAGNPIPRRSWEKILGNDGPRVQPWYDTQEDFQRDASLVQFGWKYGRGLLADYAQLGEREALAALRVSRTRESRWQIVKEHSLHNFVWRSINHLALKGGYDLLVLFGDMVSTAPLLPKSVPYITFEHGTMRYVSTLPEVPYLVPAWGYQQSDWNVITNADVWEDAGNLGIRHKSSFIPHPFDETKFTPGSAPNLRRDLCAELGCDLLFLAPARHSRSETAGSKRNDRIVHAFARYVREAEPAGAPKAGLVFFEWGDAKDVTTSRQLVAYHNLTERVSFQEARPRPVLAYFYRACDVVLDQFSDTVGSFGTTTVEAMSSGKPVISYYNPDVHTWCLDVLGEHPPVLSARTVDEIYERLVWQAKHPESRVSIGKRGRAWVERHHSLERVSKMHKALYEQVLAGRKQAVKPRELVAV